jgi:hypothetical protein
VVAPRMPPGPLSASRLHRPLVLEVVGGPSRVTRIEAISRVLGLREVRPRPTRSCRIRISEEPFSLKNEADLFL